MVQNYRDNRILWIDWAKSIGMFLVILGHCHIRESEQIVIQYIYSFHMMLFFFLSGILCRRDLSLTSIKKDIRYLIFPYLVYGFILIAFSTLRSRTFDIVVLLAQIKSLFWGDDISIGPIWFLPAMFICKQLFLIIKCAQKYKVVYWLLFFLSFYPVYYFSRYNLNIPFFADSALCGLPFFFAGNICAVFIGEIKHLRWYTRLGMSVVLIASSFVLCGYNGFVSLASCDMGQSVFLYYYDSFASLIGISIICMFFDRIKLKFVMMTSYGSLVSLGLHAIPLTILHYYVPILLGFEPSTYSVCLAIIFSSLTYCFCYISILIIDKECPLIFGLKGIRN